MWSLKNDELTKNIQSENVAAIGSNGFFVFGGLDEKRQPTNDLYFFRPEFKNNSKVIQKATGEFTHNIKP